MSIVIENISATPGIVTTGQRFLLSVKVQLCTWERLEGKRWRELEKYTWKQLATERIE